MKDNSKEKLIAFFFLKQFRVMHEEYRYYEAIKRKRQDNYNILPLIEKYHNNPEMIKIVLEIYNDHSNGKLNKEETTQILETQKIISQESDLLGKFIEFVKEAKEIKIK